MKILFACRENSASMYLAHSMAKDNYLDGIIIESGKTARREKLIRIFKKTKLLKLPYTLLNIIAIALYSQFVEKSMRKFVWRRKGIKKFPDRVKSFYTKSINSPECIKLISYEAPDILIVFGTSILKKEVINIPKKYVLNIHWGIVPKYRNVHSDFWAYLQKDYSNIGTSIIHVNEKIDSGNIAIQETIKLNPSEGLLIAKRKNLELSSKLILKLLQKAEREIPSYPQDKNLSKFYKTPELIDMIILFISVIQNKIAAYLNQSVRLKEGG